jgi:SAM-dependent methyltransferase
MQLLGRVHSRYIHPGRVERLVDLIEPLIPSSVSSVLDVGCGDGRLASELALRRPEIRVAGVDVLVRPSTSIPVTRYDGQRLPWADKSVDAIMLIDVIHHATDPGKLLGECARVSSQAVILKDHVASNRLDNLTLKAMDWVGNRHSGVSLPYRYPTTSAWRTMLHDAGLTPASWSQRVEVYPKPLSYAVGRGLHVLAVLIPEVGRAP